MTIDLRCKHNKKAAEFDPETLSVWIPCKTCTRVWGRPVSHPWALADLIRSAGAGQADGVVHPAEPVLPFDCEH